MASPYPYGPPKPGVLGLIAIVSFLLSVVDVLWFVVIVVVGFGIAAVGWLGGPIAGAAGTVVGAVFLLVGLARGLLSILLFFAAWNTLQGHPSGRSLHRNWAWITIVLDVLDLMLTFGMSPAGWWGLVYAVGVLYAMNQPEVVAYFERDQLPPASKPAGLIDDGF